MNSLSTFIMQEILVFLDVNSLKESMLVSHHWFKIITKDSFWRLKFQRLSRSSFHSGPYFKYPGHESYLDRLDCEKFKVSSFQSMKAVARKLENPQKLEIKILQTSSTFQLQKPVFWCSAPNNSPDSDEFLIFELSSESLVFSLNFIIFRTISDEGALHPPKRVKLSIGQTKDCSDFETEEFDVELTESLNTISVLPKLVSGKFLKLQLLGKQNRITGSAQWFTIIKLLEVVGYPLEFKPDPLLEYCKKGSFMKEIDCLSPFYLERLEKYGMIVKYLKNITRCENDTTSYFYEIYKNEIEENEFKMKNCEILGNYFFENRDYDSAKILYLNSRHIWGYTKVLIVTRQYGGLSAVMFEGQPNRPNLEWVLKTARELGGSELEQNIADAFRS